MLLTALLSLLGSSAVGSAIGGLFALFNRKIDLEAKRLDQAHESARWGHEAALRDKDIALAQAEAQGKAQVAIIEADGAFEAARMQAIGLAQAGDRVGPEEIKAAGKLGWLLVLASAFNKLVRPFATVIVGGAAVVVNLYLVFQFVDTWDSLSPDQRLKLAEHALQWIGAQAGAIMAYWFVSRGSGGNGRL